MKNKIFGYVEDESYNFIGEMKNKLYDKDHRKISKSMIIELALIELMNNNDVESIEQKLMHRNMI